MTKIINLKSVRKTRAREDQRQKADANAVKHGQTKSAKKHAAAKVAKQNAHLDGHKLEPKE